jgi:putative tricarboxylic transport membrane protein
VQLLKVPYRILFPCILLFCCIGVYTVNNSSVAVLLTAIFAVLGYLFAKLGCEAAPLLLGFVLGPLMEENLRRAMLQASGDPMVFLTRPISAVLIGMTVVMLLLIVLPQFRKTREEAFQE